MASRASGRRRWRWALGLAALAVPGFGLGVMAGLVWEEPGLVASYALGRTEEIGWGEGSPEPELPAVAAPVPEVSEPSTTPEEKPQKKPRKKPDRKPAAAKPAPAPKPVVSKPVSTGGGESGFSIQVGAFGERAGADRLVADLRAKGYRVYISAGEDGEKARWRVRVGPDPTREAAELKAARLKQTEKLPTWVLEEDG